MDNFWWKIVLLIVIFIVLLIIIPLKIKTKVFYNVLKNEGKIQLKFFQLNVFSASFLIGKGYIEIIKSNGKIILEPISITSKQEIESDFIFTLIKKIKLKKATIYINFGAKTDAFLTAMITGISKLVTSILGAIIHSKKTDSKIKNKIYPNFQNDSLKISLKASIKISILQIIFSYFESLKSRTKINKEIAQNE